jgi:hypothetical protein
VKNRLRILLLLTLALVLTAAGDLSAARPGLICGTPDDPIPCSTFNGGGCIYTYDRDSNCCLPSSPPCLGICC